MDVDLQNDDTKIIDKTTGESAAHLKRIDKIKAKAVILYSICYIIGIYFLINILNYFFIF